MMLHKSSTVAPLLPVYDSSYGLHRFLAPVLPHLFWQLQTVGRKHSPQSYLALPEHGRRTLFTPCGQCGEVDRHLFMPVGRMMKLVIVIQLHPKSTSKQMHIPIEIREQDIFTDVSVSTPSFSAEGSVLLSPVLLRLDVRHEIFSSKHAWDLEIHFCLWDCCCSGLSCKNFLWGNRMVCRVSSAYGKQHFTQLTAYLLHVSASTCVLALGGPL